MLECWSVLLYVGVFWSVLGCRRVHNLELGVENPFLSSSGGGGKPIPPLLVRAGMGFPPPAQKITLEIYLGVGVE
jgi:hypothetical protein